MGIYQDTIIRDNRHSLTRKIVIGVIALIAILFLSWLKGWWIPNRPDPDRYPVRGIDVSHHNGKIDWSRVARSGVDFAFIKATEGADWTDARCANNWTEAGKNGIVRGGYHFFSTASSGEAQALNFIQTVPSEKGILPPVIDLEFSQSNSRMSDEEFFRELEILKNTLENRYGVPPIIYTTREFHENYLAGREMENLWVREVGSRPKGWSADWLFWQYSSRGNVPGIRGRVDLNVYRNSRDKFRKLLTR